LELPSLYRGHPCTPARIADAVAEEVVLESEDPFYYTIDGDTHRADRRLKITAGPRLTFILQ
jgi:hypothetical protein